jgi:asparagine synthase (glutamine-hydrolysing)
MCGISGIIRKDGLQVGSDRIRRMNDLAAHRGPDGDGYFHAPGIALGHRRLAILDLNPRGAQPMARGDRYQIVFNGEVYNFLELRTELESLGHRFSTGTDTEVILAAYSEWGADCLPRFNGMWAFAIYDAQRREVFLARDRFGVKPLYYTTTDREFGFASEIKQVLSLLPRASANASVLLEWITLSFESHRPETMFRGIASLPPGHRMWVKVPDGAARSERWYSLGKVSGAEAMGPGEAAAALRATFEDSVRLRLRADVRVGTCLSGGLDSSATSAVASRQYRAAGAGRFLAVHARATESEIDELRWARRIAESEDLDLSVVTPSTDDFAASLDEVVYTQEEPFLSPSMFMGWFVFREARARGCPVMLNGQGADEVLLGYERYFTAATLGQPWWRKLMSAYHESRRSRLTLFDALRYKAYFGRSKVRGARLRRRSFLRPEVAERVDFSWIDRATDSFGDVRRLQESEIGCWQLPKLLRYEDRNSMRHSIETRLPFLDYRLVELGVSMPVSCKIHSGWTKYALRLSMEGTLPPEIIWRTDKVGFEAPSKTWIRGREQMARQAIADSPILRSICDVEALLAGFGRMDPWRKWQFLNVAVWERVYDVRLD